MTVVVTGAAGFLGRHLVTRLLADGSSVVGIDRRPTAVDGSTHLRADLAAGSSDVDAVLARAEAVFHLAATPGVRLRGPQAAHRRWRDNVVAGDHVLRATPPATPVIVTSSSAVYGGARPVAQGLRPSREDDVVRPHGGYARSKVLLERLCARRAAAGGRVAVVRPFTIVGEGQRADMAVARWLVAARQGLPLTIHGSDTRRRDLTDVRSVVDVLVRVWSRGCDTTVNAGTGRPVTLDRVVRMIGEVLGVTPTLTFARPHRDEVSDTSADVRRCAELLGMVPTTDLRDIVRRQLAASSALAGARS